MTIEEAMDRHSAMMLAAYARSPRHIVRYCGHVVQSISIDGDYVSFEDGRDRPIDNCSINAFEVYEIVRTDWRRPR